ncbi:hypothetical protein DFP72DRAFT_860418 [Ephemerocybe angulata]|uniref:Uncharacterized protein n=1 Tax=Ephemerocybe angulata TaxID=980116 RepID=A0A8H6H8R2_9AGAR|nr:hypothetical protein DFP72DRAFT_860418 [Tulosesus angulatus]
MRTTFVWLYLKAKYSIQESRNATSTRVWREARKMRAKGLTTEPTDEKQPSPAMAVNDQIARPETVSTMSCYRAAYWIEYDSFQDRFRVQGAPPSRTRVLGHANVPPSPHYLPLSPAFVNVKLLGDLFGEGTFQLTTPWTHIQEAAVHLLHNEGYTLREETTNVKVVGERYDRVTLCPLPPGLLVGLGISELQGNKILSYALSVYLPTLTYFICLTGATITIELDLNDHGIFLMNALNAVLPQVQPVSHLILTFRFPDNLESLSRSFIKGIPTASTDARIVHQGEEPYSSPEVPTWDTSYACENIFSFPDPAFTEPSEALVHDTSQNFPYDIYHPETGDADIRDVTTAGDSLDAAPVEKARSEQSDSCDLRNASQNSPHIAAFDIYYPMAGSTNGYVSTVTTTDDSATPVLQTYWNPVGNVRLGSTHHLNLRGASQIAPYAVASGTYDPMVHGANDWDTSTNTVSRCNQSPVGRSEPCYQEFIQDQLINESTIFRPIASTTFYVNPNCVF